MIKTFDRIISLYASKQFVTFLLVGGIALLFHWLSRFAFNTLVDYGWAIVLAYLVGMGVGYALNRVYVFPYSKRPFHSEIFLFFLVNIASFPLVWVAAFVLGEWILVKLMIREQALALGHGLAILFPVFVNFALHKFITFRET